MNSANGDRTSNSPDLSVRHLYAEMARLDLLLGRLVKRWAAAGQDPTDAFRGLYVSDAEAGQLLRRPLGGSWADFAPPSDAGLPDPVREAGRQVEALSNRARAEGRPARLDALVEAFELSPFEKDVLLLAAAPALDLRYQRIFGYLQDDVTRRLPSPQLALDLCTDPDERLARRACFHPAAPLFRHQFIAPLSAAEPLLAQPLQIDPAVPAWLLGQYAPENLTPYGPADADFSLPPFRKDLILALNGPDQLARRHAARQVSARAERPLLTLDLEDHADDPGLALRVARLLRDARLLQAIPELTGWERVLHEDAPPLPLLQAVLAHPDLVLISSALPWQARGVPRSRRIHVVAFPVPVYRQRLRLWQEQLVGRPEVPALDLPHLAGQFALTSGQIHDAFAAAADAAAQRGEPFPSQADLLAAARSHSNPRLGLLARKIDPRFGWDDIILPREQRTILCEITATVRQRPRVLDEWGVGAKLASSRGVTVLFAGPPGTGKTMAAEIMASDLGLDLYKIDLSGVVSKYIGETEKNLEKVFAEAASSNAILFFDEADALFGKRSEVRDAHDRYANLEISYLLQRMEAYDGVTILATNLRANLDDAFTRRLQFAVDFPFPEEEDRLRIWKALLPPELPLDPQADFALLARRFRIAGGNIRNVIVNAAYLAAADGGVVTMEHLLHGTRRELQKMGRLLNEEDLASP